MAQVQPRQSLKRKIGELSEHQTSALDKSPTKQEQEQEQLVQQQQSFAMVQALLLSSVATFASLRGLFPDDCFEKLNYSDVRDDALRIYSCNEDVAKRNPNQNTRVKPNGRIIKNPWAIKVLARGKNPGSDQLLDWLNVILEGVLRKDLDGVQFSIFADRENPSHVLESYAFSFQYLERIRSEDCQVFGLALSGPCGKSVTVTSARSGLDRIIRRLIEIDITLPNLPENRFMTCHLLHKQKISHLLIPRGFRQCQDPTMSVPDNKLWCVKSLELGSIESDFYSVGLKVVHLALVNDTESNSEEAVFIPQKMIYNKHLSRVQQFGLKPAMTESKPKNRDVIADDSVDIDFCSAEVEEEQYRIRPDVERGIESISDVDLSSYPMTERNLQPPQGSLILTQELDVNSHQHMRLLPSKILEMNIKRDDISVNGIESQNDETCCECDFNAKEGKMFRCSCCEMLQHCHCYGYALDSVLEGFKDDDQRFCYTCLLEDTDQSRLKQLKRLAQFRRALWVSYEQGYPSSPAAFAKMLRCDARTTAQITQQMKDEGYLTPGTKSRLVLVDSVEQNKIRDHDYCNPMTLIKIYYTSSQGDED